MPEREKKYIIVLEANSTKSRWVQGRVLSGGFRGEDPSWLSPSFWGLRGALSISCLPVAPPPPPCLPLPPSGILPVSSVLHTVSVSSMGAVIKVNLKKTIFGKIF